VPSYLTENARFYILNGSAHFVWFFQFMAAASNKLERLYYGLLGQKLLFLRIEVLSYSELVTLYPHHNMHILHGKRRIICNLHLNQKHKYLLYSADLKSSTSTYLRGQHVCLKDQKDLWDDNATCWTKVGVTALLNFLFTPTSLLTRNPLKCSSGNSQVKICVH